MVLLAFWLMFSYGFVFAIGAALISAGAGLFGWAICLLVPLARLALRFRKGGGYRLFGSNNFGGNVLERNGFMSRRDHPIVFRICLFMELAVLVAAVVIAIQRM